MIAKATKIFLFLLRTAVQTGGALSAFYFLGARTRGAGLRSSWASAYPIAIKLTRQPAPPEWPATLATILAVVLLISAALAVLTWTNSAIGVVAAR